MTVYAAWSDDPDALAAIDTAGPWREVWHAAGGVVLVDSEESLSRVYHDIKWQLPDDSSLFVAPLAGAKSRGLRPGTTTWLRRRLSSGGPGAAPRD